MLSKTIVTFLLSLIGIKRSCSNCYYYRYTLLCGSGKIIPSMCEVNIPCFAKAFKKRKFSPEFCYCQHHRINFWILRFLDPSSGYFPNVVIKEVDFSNLHPVSNSLTAVVDSICGQPIEAESIKFNMVVDKDNVSFPDIEEN